MSSSLIIWGLVVVLVLIIMFQISKLIEYSNIIRGENDSKKYTNKLNSVLLIAFLVIGLFSIYKFHHDVGAKKILTISSSVEGETYDVLLWITISITGVVFLVTQILLFWFAFRYRYCENRKPVYFSHSNKLELIWTTIPAITMLILVSSGLSYWYKITGQSPENSMKVEIVGKQFEWIIRYPGKDNIFGKRHFKNINDINNRLGQIWDDNSNYDDIIVDELHLVVGKPVEILVGSRDVIHDVGLPHFRQKVDAVPGLPTRMWFTPKYTTEDMRSKTNNPDFDYEIACDQMCGKGHYSMRAVVVVQTQKEFDSWLASKKPYYESIKEELAAEKKSNPLLASNK